MTSRARIARGLGGSRQSQSRHARPLGVALPATSVRRFALSGGESCPARPASDILIDVEQDEKPAAYRGVGYLGAPRPLAYLPKRSHLEWHLFRGVAPIARRPTITPALRARVIERDGLVCGICAGPVEPADVHLDHVKPFSKGGPTTFANLRVTHSVCNMRKGAKV